MKLENIKKLQDLDVKNKTVLVRVDYNVPLENGKVSNNKRITATEKTIKYLLENNCKVVLMSHLGRPKGKVNMEFSLAPVAPEVSTVFGVKVTFAKDCIGAEAASAIAAAKNGEIVLLENLRFHAEEEANDAAFAAELAKNGQVFVQEAFGTVHRAHASTAAIAKLLPGGIGYLVQKEVEFLGDALANPARPFAAIIGGAKVSDKIMVLNTLLDKVNVLVIGGGMAYTFLKAQGFTTGKSLMEADKIEEAKKILASAKTKNVEILLPVDNVCSTEFSNETPVMTTTDANVPEGQMGLDIGPKTIALFDKKLMECKTIFWNGPVGAFEMSNFEHGSFAIAKTMEEATKKGCVTIIGGGDSLNVLKKAKMKTSVMSHCSTGGGASMEFVEGKELPGLVALAK